MHMTVSHGRGRLQTFDAPSGSFFPAETVRYMAPAVFQTEMHESRSPKHYKQTSVAGLFEQADALGLGCTQVKVAGVKTLGRDGFQKHILTFERRDDIFTGGDRSRLYAMNSHDGTTGHWLWIGKLRMVCENGLMSGSVDDMIRTRHAGNAAGKIAEAIDRMLGRWATMDETIEGWKNITLSPDEYYEYASQAAALRWDGEEAKPVVGQLLRVHRPEDAAHDLWTVFNRVQENLVRGGVQVRSIGQNGRNRIVRARGVNQIDANAKLNRDLWSLTETFAKAA